MVVSDNEKAQRRAADPLADQPKSSLPPPPSSIINVYELTFGSVCGICAGIFLKKGAKAVAFVFGGAFVLLQVSSLLYAWSIYINAISESTSPRSPSYASIGSKWAPASKTCSTQPTRRQVLARRHPLCLCGPGWLNS